jgi:hypothetical protein
MLASEPSASEPLRCLSCWYVVSDAPDAGPIPDGILCPECGTPVTDHSRRIAVVRSAMIRESVRPARWGFAIMAAGVLAYAAVAAFQGQSAFMVASIITSGLAGLVVLAASVLPVIPWYGSARRATNPEIERRLVALLWLKHLVWLAVPWLTPVPAGLALLAVMLLTGTIFGDRDTAQMFNLAAGMIIVLAGCGAVIVSMLEWTDRWNKHLDHAVLRSTDVPTRSMLVAILVSTVSVLVGLAASIAMIAFVFETTHRAFGW